MELIVKMAPWAIGGFVAFAVIAALLAEKRKAKLTDLIRSQVPGFNPSKIYVVGVFDQPLSEPIAIAVDREAMKICFVEDDAKSTDGRRVAVFTHRELVSVELLSNGRSVTQTRRNCGLARAAAFGVLTGGAGAVVGALTAGQTSQTTDKVTSLALLVTVDDLDKPLRKIVFVDSSDGVDKDDVELDYGAAREWHAMLSVLIRRADQEGQAADKSAPAQA